MHAGCTRPKDLSALAESGTALIQGHYSLGNGCETARGHFLISDPLQVLRKVAKDPDDDMAWLGHFLWLCDGSAGPCAPTMGSATDQPEMITTRFRMALDNVLARRMKLRRRSRSSLLWIPVRPRSGSGSSSTIWNHGCRASRWRPRT